MIVNRTINGTLQSRFDAETSRIELYVLPSPGAFAPASYLTPAQARATAETLLRLAAAAEEFEPC